MKSLILLLCVAVLFNYAIGQVITLDINGYNQDQAAKDSFNLGWPLLVKDAVAQRLFTSDMVWSNIEPKCTFKKSIEGGTSYQFLGNANNQNGDVCRYLIYVNYLSSGPTFDYYSYFYKDYLGLKFKDGPLSIEDRVKKTPFTAPATVTAELAPQEEAPEDFEVPEVEVLAEENIEVQAEVTVGEDNEVEIEVEIEANANPLEGYLPIELDTIANDTQAQPARDDGLKLAIENMIAKGEINDGTWTLVDTLKAYVKTVDGGIEFYFAVTIEDKVNGFTLDAAVEFYVVQDASGVNQLKLYKLGEEWPSAFEESS